MSVFASSLPHDLARHLAAVDLSQVRADQRWVLNVMRQDGPALIRLLWRMLGREQDVLDAYQECFCRLIACERTADGPPPRGYVFRMAMNISIDLGRRRRTQREHMRAVATASNQKASQNGGHHQCPELLVEELRAAIESLPPRLREVIAMRDLAEMSYRQVARVLGLTVGTARVYRREAIVALSVRMGAGGKE